MPNRASEKPTTTESGILLAAETITAEICELCRQPGFQWGTPEENCFSPKGESTHCQITGNRRPEVNKPNTAPAQDQDHPTHLKVIVDRSIWLRGATQASRLEHHTTAHKCCMGIACAADGITHGLNEHSYIDTMLLQGPELEARHRAIRLFATEPSARPDHPVTDPRHHKLSPTGHVIDYLKPMTHVVDLLYSLNDDQDLDDATRERYLTDAGRAAHIDFVFTGEALPRHIEQDRVTNESPGNRGPASQRAEPRAVLAAYSRLDTHSRTWFKDPSTRQPVKRNPQTNENRTCYELLREYADQHSDSACRLQLYDQDENLLIDRYTEPHG